MRNFPAQRWDATHGASSTGRCRPLGTTLGTCFRRGTARGVVLNGPHCTTTATASSQQTARQGVSPATTASVATRPSDATAAARRQHGQPSRPQYNSSTHARRHAAPRRLTLKQLSDLVRTSAPGSGAAQAAITMQVQQCSNFHDIGELFVEFAPMINHINVAAMVCRLSKVREAMVGPAVAQSEQLDTAAS